MRIVQKFGGTSVADIARLETVALKIKREVEAGHQVAVVVSAMAGVTNQLVGHVKSLAGDIQSREYDAVVATGEQITTGLLALALQQIGVPARSFMGWQIPIYTDNNHGNARITSVDSTAFFTCWEAGVVPVVAGFQGMTVDRCVTTLGRGGSDTTAVAIAAAVKADRCDIYTDVDGVYTADPRIVPLAQKLDHISYAEMLELASLGAKVLHAPCVDMAQHHNVNVRVLSSFEDRPGTDILNNIKNSDEPRLSGITHSTGWVLLKLYSHHPLDEQAKQLTKRIQTRDVPAEIAVCVSPPEHSFISLLMPQAYLATAIELIEERDNGAESQADSPFFNMTIESGLAKVGVVGLNLIFKNGYSEQLLKIINQQDLSVTIIALTAEKFCLCMAETSAPDFIRTLHHQFGLDKSKEFTKHENTQEPLATRL